MVEAIFLAALEKSAGEREAVLAGRCGGDAGLRAEVEELLAADAVQPDFLRGAAGDGFKAEEAGETIGHYKLREQIGEGGFGTVWVAEQEHPVRRRVALKIIKLGMDTKEVIARFEQERQALAMMDHPNIAKMLDAGVTRHGRPFFVMELVRGMKITEYCDDQGLSMKERVELFITVCQAVQHAHQKGIIHRDLKPSNILVTVNDGVAVPKVIDFGVAKATQGRLAEHTIYTQFEQMIGTPLYMSPEQAGLTSLDVDTRSDIYSLGVLLYELLTGRTPIDKNTLASAGLDEVRRIIREVEPPRPSARLKTLAGDELTTAAKRRHMDSAKLCGALRGDLDWIVMKCIEKDRKRRYDTANGLALDLQRHLHNEVVVARPPTTAYLLGKLIRRNKLAFAASAAIAVSLVIGIAVSVWQAVRATAAEKSSAALLDELRLSAPAFVEQARGLAAKEQYDAAIKKLDYAIKLRTDEAEYMVAKADLLQCQLKLAEAAAVYREALRVNPGLARAEASAKLCDKLLAAPANADGRLSRESLALLHLAMQRQQRPAAELMPVARLLGEEKKLLVDYWIARLKDLPVSAENPLRDRLTVRDDGRLALDLSGTKVTDLSPLAGAPLAVLNVSTTGETSELTDLSPLRGLDLLELNINGTNVADLSPLSGMRSLEKLEMSNSKVTDLTALSALRLRWLALRGCAMSDLAPLRKMPLEEIDLCETRVTDLSPLVEMPLKGINLSITPVRDFSPLARLPLENCNLQGTLIADLTVLRGMPLKALVLQGCTAARNYGVLSEIKTLELLVLDGWYRSTLPEEDYAAIGRLRAHPALRQIGAGRYNPRENFRIDPKGSEKTAYAATGSKEAFWQEWDRDQAFVPALRKSGINFNLHKHASGADHLIITKQPLRDLAILKGARVGILTLESCPFTDLAPLHDLPLETLELRSEVVTDLSPLRGMNLTTLELSGSKFSDLTPLAGMPLKALYLHKCANVTDVAVAAQIPTLEHLTVPVPARGITELRKLGKLQRLAFSSDNINVELNLPLTTVAEFWREFDANPWIERLRESGNAKSMKRLDDGTWEVNLADAAIADLTILRGAPISILGLQKTNVADLEPLRGMPLKKIWLTGTRVTDLGPLRGMPLELLSMSDNTQVTDLSAVRGMPLLELRLEGCTAITNLSALADAKSLQSIILPPNAKNLEFLRTFPKLARIGYRDDPKNGHRPDKSAEQFWKEYDGKGWLRALLKAVPGLKPPKQLADGTWDVDFSATGFSDLALLKGAAISKLTLKGAAISDLSPLRDLPLTRLILNDCPAVRDLSPLQGMRLDRLEFRNTKVADLSPLRGMPLESLQLGGTDVADLEPLRGMRLKSVFMYDTKITDLRPLEGMPIELFNLNSTKVKDLAVVRGMPLTSVRLHGCSELVDVSPLQEARELTELTLPPNAKNYDFLRAFPKLTRLGFKELPSHVPNQTAAEFWNVFDAQGWVRVLRDSGVAIKALDHLADGTWAVDLGKSNLKDLAILRGAPISDLNLGNTAVTDLSPLRGMPLKRLVLNDTSVSDLSPLKGLPIERLYLSRTKVTDLSSLQGMPLTFLNLRFCPAITDFSPLREAKALKVLFLPTNAKDLEFLRALPNLERLSFQEDEAQRKIPDKTAAEFWKAYDAKKK